MYLDCFLSIADFEISVFIVKIQRYSQLTEDPKKNSSERQQPCHHTYKENFYISRSLTFFNNDSCFQTNEQHIYSDKNDERHYAMSPEMWMTSVIRLHSNMTSISP